MFKSIRLGLAAALMFGGLMVGGAATAASPADVTPAEGKALQDLVDNLMLPAASDLTDAISTAATDQPKACALAQKALAELTESQTRFQAIHDGIVARGGDTSDLQDLKARMDAILPKAREASTQICSGDLSGGDQDPEVAAGIKKITDYVRAYQASETIAMHAKAAGDTKTFCASERDTAATLAGMYDYVSGLIQQARSEGATDKDLGEFAGLLGQIQGWKAENAEDLKECPAA